MNGNNKDGFSIFGYEITKKIDAKNDIDTKKVDAPPIVPEIDDSEVVHTIGGGYFGHSYDITGIEDLDSISDRDLVYKYRVASQHAEVATAIDNIVDEAIASLEYGPPVKILLDDLDYEDTIKTLINNEFNTILKLLNFSEKGSKLFRDWYIEGKLYIHIAVDRNNPEDGIYRITHLDAARVKKVKEVEDVVDEKTKIPYQQVVKEYYVYDLSENPNQPGQNAIELPIESVIEVDSGIRDETGRRTYSHIHKALKPINQLRIMEDSLVIYRLARAPERRIFYIDTGNLPKGKAEEYLNTVMSKYRNKIVYDANTGTVKDSRKHMSMLEDFWLPRREGGRGTEIETLPGGDNLGQIDDILYFKEQLYKSLNIPTTRLEADNGFNAGRATEITRDEVKFQKFINRLRQRFAKVFIGLLKTQLQLKGVASESDWEDMAQNIHIDFVQDNHFYELLDAEILQDRLNLLRDLKDHVGTYYSHAWVQRHVLKLSEQEIEKMNSEMDLEKDDPRYNNDNSGF